jgi:Leucine-rich repeat (LRR) protein
VYQYSIHLLNYWGAIRSFLVRRCITNLSKEHTQHPSFVVDEEESKLIIIMAQNGDNTDADEYLPDYKDQARLHPRDVTTARRANRHDTTPDVNLNLRHRDQPKKQPILSSSLPPLAKNAVVAAVVTTATTISAPIGANHHPTLPIADALPIVFVYGSSESNASGPTSTGASPNSSSTNLLHHQNDDAGSSSSSSNSSRSRSPKMNESSILFQVSRTTCRWSLIIILLLIVVSVIGGLCGAGKCSTSSSYNTSNNGHNDSTEVNTTVPQNTTTTKPSNVAAYLRSISLITANTDTDDSKNHEYFVMAENMTIDWLTKKDPLVLSLDDPADLFRLRQRFALVNLWFGTTVQNETFNMLWDEYHGWRVALEECDWYGVTCTIHDFIDDDDPTKSSWGKQSVVEDISMPSNSLQGRLSPNLGLFERLQRIDFSDNRLIGSIPSSLSCNTFLSSVITPMNILTGTIPEEFGSLTNMTFFSIYGNMLSGTIPNALGQWTNLAFLYAADNTLNGTLPELIGQRWSHMEELDISSNMFHGAIPSSIGLWSKLRIFSIAVNFFSGTIPETIGNWSMIETAYFNGNSFTGSVPEAICNATNLTTLVATVSCMCCTNVNPDGSTINEPTPSPPLVMDVEVYIRSVARSGGNNASPTMEAELAAIEWLIYDDPLGLNPYDEMNQFRLRQRYALLTVWFSMSDANQTWTVDDGWLDMPEECDWYGISCIDVDSGDGLGNQSVVESILLPLNSLQGRISPDLSMLTRLSYLDLSGNSLTGTFPVALSECGFLNELKIHNNSLTGTIPEEYGNLWNNLTHFSIFNNGFSGTLPDSIGQWSDLVWFNVEINDFFGPVPNSIAAWENIEYMYWNQNSFTGTIPENLGNSTPGMKEFQIVNNSMNGTIPSSLGMWTNIQHFDVSENSFTGTIPASISNNWVVVETVDWSNNDLTGTVPSGFCALTTVTYLAADMEAVECSCCDCCA